MTGVRSLAEDKDFSSSLCVQTSLEAHLASYSMRTRGPFLGSKVWSGHDTDHSHHLVPRSRMSRSYTFSSHCCLHESSGTATIQQVISLNFCVHFSCLPHVLHAHHSKKEQFLLHFRPGLYYFSVIFVLSFL
jgi:hypothetical protein